MIPVMKPKLPDSKNLAPWLAKIDSSNTYSNFGPLTWELRVAYSKYLGVDASRIIPLSNATLALQGVLEIANRSNWILPDYTFAATGHAAVATSRDVFFADVNLEDFQLDIPTSIELSDFGVIPVMPFGAPIDFTNWEKYPSVVIDAAASLGSTPPNFELMPENTAVVYSLHATKVLGAGEGAIVVLQNEDLANQLRAWSNFGFDGTRVSSIKSTNAKMSEFTAAVALASLEGLITEESEWADALNLISQLDIPSRYRTVVDGYSGFRPYWIIQARNLEERRRLEHFLKSGGVETRSWWASPLSEMPAFSRINKLGENLNSKLLSETHLGLPIWRGISQSEMSLIEKLLNSFEP
jgi:dTDP-4-amino-4,6-dideoxygalactose transaminase